MAEKINKKTALNKEMEIIGLLSSEIAHDLNNILTGIMGYSQIILMDMDKKDKNLKGIKEIENAANKGSSIAEILSYLKLRNVKKEKDIRLDDIIKKNEKRMFARLKETVSKNLDLDSKNLLEIDPLLFANILFNLIVFLDKVMDISSIVVKTRDSGANNNTQVLMSARGGVLVKNDSLKFLDAAESIKRFKLQGAALYMAKETAKGQNISIDMSGNDEGINIKLDVPLGASDGQ